MVFAFFFVLLIVSIGFWFHTTCTIEEYRLVISFSFSFSHSLKHLQSTNGNSIADPPPFIWMQAVRAKRKEMGKPPLFFFPSATSTLIVIAV